MIDIGIFLIICTVICMLNLWRNPRCSTCGKRMYFAHEPLIWCCTACGWQEEQEQV